MRRTPHQPVGRDDASPAPSIQLHLRAILEKKSEGQELGDESREILKRVQNMENTLESREEEIEKLADKLRQVKKQRDEILEAYNENVDKEPDNENEESESTPDSIDERVLDVRDNLVRALNQDEGTSIRKGVEATLTQFDGWLEDNGLQVLAPEEGVDFDPEKHEAIEQIDSQYEEGQVARVYRHGYATESAVIRPARVAVSKGEE